MHKELELWNFVAERLCTDSAVMLLVVASSSGSSPGRQGYKMAVGSDGELSGSIGGGVMEVNLVEQSRAILSDKCRGPHVSKGETHNSFLRNQTHQKNAADASGMICSGRQTVIFRLLTSEDDEVVDAIIDAVETMKQAFVTITQSGISVGPPKGGTPNFEGATAHAVFHFEKQNENDFTYTERIGPKNNLYIIGGGHCSLALSELMSKMDFRITIFDDRPDLNTIEKNNYADKITIIDTYENIADLIPPGENNYVVVMTLGYKSDEIVVRQLMERDSKYFGVLGSKAKMATLLGGLKKEGFSAERLANIRTPIGIPINSRTPEEIAVSIAAEIISLKNG